MERKPQVDQQQLRPLDLGQLVQLFKTDPRINATAASDLPYFDVETVRGLPPGGGNQ